MIQAFVQRFMQSESELMIAFSTKHPEHYRDLIKSVVEHIQGAGSESPSLDPERIHEIDDGHYQGTLLYVIAAKGYQPCTYYAVTVDYGSCSGCDTLEAINGSGQNPPNLEQAKQYWTLALHIVQRLRCITDPV